MGFIDTIKNLISPKTTPTKAKQTPYANVSGSGMGLFAGIAYNGTALENNGTVFSVITRLSNTLSSLPLNVMVDGVKQTNNVANVMRKPNFNINGFELINKLETDRNTYGNGYALIKRDRLLQPEEIWPVNPLRVSPYIDSDTGKLYYRIAGDHGAIMADSSDVIHVKHVTGAGRYVGISPLDVLKASLGYDEVVTQYAVDNMTKVDSFKVRYGANISEQQKDSVYKAIAEFVSNNGGALFEEPGVEINEIDRKSTTTAVKENDEITRKRIANVYNVPLSMLNDSASTGVVKNEEEMLRFVTSTMLPIIKQYESQFNEKLLTDNDFSKGMYFHFNVNALLRADAATRGQFYASMRRNSGISANEIRSNEDMPKSNDPHADELVVSGDLYPIDASIAERRSGSTVGRPPSTPDEKGENDGKTN